MPEPRRWRKKPVVVEALRFDGDREAARAFLGDDLVRSGGDGSIRVRTLEGNITASVGDWLIRGVQGEHYPCKSNIFDATYEAVSDA